MTPDTASPLWIEPGENPSRYMRGIPVPPEARVTRDLSWATDGEKALWATQNVSRIVPVDVLARGEGPVWALPHGPSALGAEVRGADGQHKPLTAAVAEIRANGFLAIRKGRIVAELYRNGLRPQTRHALFSVTKSMLGMTCGVLIGDGLLDPIRPARDYLPELDTCGFRDATLQQVMDMTASVDWNHNRDDPRASVNLNSIAGGFTTLPIEVPFANTLEFIQSLGPKDPHGTIFTYNPANTEILGWIISRLTGQVWQQVFADRIWSQIGAEQDAFVTVDGGGHGFATAGMQACLRDMGRIGLLLARGGVAGSRRILPQGFVADIGCEDPALRQAMARSVHAEAGEESATYRNQFWVQDGARGEFCALGFLGQTIYIDRASDTVVVVLSAVPGPQTRAQHRDLARQIAAWPDVPSAKDLP